MKKVALTWRLSVNGFVCADAPLAPRHALATLVFGSYIGDTLHTILSGKGDRHMARRILLASLLTLSMAALVLATGSGCGIVASSQMGPSKVGVSNTPEGAACVRQCENTYQLCVNGCPKGLIENMFFSCPATCYDNRDVCFLTCPGAHKKS
jgi:hypothetical protein